MFCLLAEHPGPDISIAAAASLTALPPAHAAEALTELSDLHLIDEHAPRRYALHDLLRLYATELLAAPDSAAETPAAGRRMADHYLHTAWAAALAMSQARSAPDLEPAAAGVTAESFADSGQALAWLTAEHQVLMRIIGYAAGHGLDVHAWLLPWALNDYLDRVGLWHDFAASQRTALAAATRLGDVTAQAHAHQYLGRAYFQLQDLDSALRHLTGALELRRRLDTPVREAAVNLDLCMVHEQRGDPAAALGSARRALDLYESVSHRVGEAHARNSVGYYQALLGNYAEGLGQCGRALEICEELDYQGIAGHTWHSLGFIRAQLGQHDQAATCFERAVEVLHPLRHLYLEAVALTALGEARQMTGDLPAARRSWQDALSILDDLGHPDSDKLRARIE
jgi:tetratricopeptide (TPR) repeat protein